MQEKKHYRYIIILSMFYALLLLTASSLTHKFFIIDTNWVSAGSFIMPLWFVLTDIITEVYGYEMSRRLIWSLMIANFFIYLILYFVTQIQHTSTNGLAYYTVFGSMLRIYFSVWICLFFSNFINTYCIARLKIIFRSRHFWIRSIAASGLGETLYTATGFYAILGGIVPQEKLWQLILWGTLLKILVSIIAAGPATIIATLIKSAEGINIYDTNIDFNPFKFKI